MVIKTSIINKLAELKKVIADEESTVELLSTSLRIHNDAIKEAKKLLTEWQLALDLIKAHEESLEEK